MKLIKALPLKHLFLTVILLSINACGGGTVSTEGLSNTRVQGTVTNANGAALIDVEIMDSETGVSAVTDKTGSFELETQVTGDSLTLNVTSEKVQEQIEIGNIPPEDSQIDLTIVVDKGEEIVTVTELEVAVAEDSPLRPTPGPDLTPAPTDTPDVEEPFVFNSISGSLKLPSGEPVVGAQIGVAGDEIVVETNLQGEFFVQTRQIGESLTLKILYLGKAGEITLEKLPSENNLSIRIELLLNLPSASDISIVEDSLPIEFVSLSINSPPET